MTGRGLPILLLAVLVAGPPAGAGSPTTPEVVDAVGDAHGVNGQGQAAGEPLANGPDARPASIDSADLRAVWFETTFKAEKLRRSDGSVTAVQHVPNGLRVHVRTTAPPRPSFGPTLVYRVPMSISGCDFNITYWIRGSSSLPSDALERAELQLLRDVCPGGGRTLQGLSYSAAGNVVTVTIPHATLPPDVAGMFARGATLAPFGSRVHVRTQIVLPTAPAIDEAPLGRSFVYGSDLPPDIDCDAEPAHAACASP